MNNPISDSGSKRIDRGGFSNMNASYSTVLSYNGFNAIYAFNFLGFRIVRNKG